MRDFEGKVAFVTGGASGIGLAIARAFGRARMRVMLADIETRALNEAVAELKSAGVDARGVECDVAERSSVQHAANETISAFGKVHLVCNNAGVGCGGPIERITPGDWDWVIGVNMTGIMHGIQTFLPLVKAHGEGGHFVTTASMAGMVAGPGVGAYTASKYGAVALTETLAAELAGSSIGVSLLCTGYVRTRIASSARNRPEHYGDKTDKSGAAEAPMAALVRSGIEPDVVAEKIMRAIEANDLYVFTSPEFRPFVEQRFKAILDAFPNP